MGVTFLTSLLYTMDEFSTGFTVDSNARPGYTLENEDFKLTFSSVLCDERKNFVSHGFECCYDWDPVMRMILKATENYKYIEEVEAKIENMLTNWLTTFQGWGLL